MQKRLTTEEIRELKRRRAALSHPLERIAFDNQWVGGVPVGLILLASDEVDSQLEGTERP